MTGLPAENYNRRAQRIKEDKRQVGSVSEFRVKTGRRVEFVDITGQVRDAVRESGTAVGMAHVAVPHTTAAVTVNENADPDVVNDVIMHLERLVPQDGGYRHSEGNSDAHVKASIMGCSEMLPVEEGRLVLGTWQGVYFCEFDGPRTRRVRVTVTGDPV